MPEMRQENSVRAFYNGLGQLRDVCSFEDMEHFIFHAKHFKCK